MLDAIRDAYKANPAIANSFIAAAVGLLASLGLHLPPGFEMSVTSLVTLLAGVLTRAQVTPTIGRDVSHGPVSTVIVDKGAF